MLNACVYVCVVRSRLSMFDAVSSVRSCVLACAPLRRRCSRRAKSQRSIQLGIGLANPVNIQDTNLSQSRILNPFFTTPSRYLYYRRRIFTPSTTQPHYAYPNQLSIRDNQLSIRDTQKARGKQMLSEETPPSKIHNGARIPRGYKSSSVAEIIAKGWKKSIGAK